MKKNDKLRKILAAEGLLKQASNSSFDLFREIIDGRMMPELSSAVAKAVGSTKDARASGRTVSISGAKKIWGEGWMDNEPEQAWEDAVQKRAEDAARALTRKFGVVFEVDPDGWSDYTEEVGFLVDLDELRLAYLSRNLK